ncbi:hypothetical protein AWB68_08974 [Caballeronia choica]|uniref:Uncharacterized protein n=1 Tax=Caballeronia choica TaxID=326476 RepID=A0A158L6U2_9BURK|nr:hypothetical protein AWB68_08974 [Caballeronia choica]
MPVIQIVRKRFPAFEAVVECCGDSGSVRHTLPLRKQPCVKFVGDGASALLTHKTSSIGFKFRDVAFDFIQCAEVSQRRLGQLALVLDV